MDERNTVQPIISTPFFTRMAVWSTNVLILYTTGLRVGQDAGSGPEVGRDAVNGPEVGRDDGS